MFTDDELAAQALAADPDVALADDAPTFAEVAGDAGASPLVASWYMPAPMLGRSSSARWVRRVALMLVATFVLIEAYGLCSTYGR